MSSNQTKNLTKPATQTKANPKPFISPFIGQVVDNPEAAVNGLSLWGLVHYDQETGDYALTDMGKMLAFYIARFDFIRNSIDFVDFETPNVNYIPEKHVAKKATARRKSSYRK